MPKLRLKITTQRAKNRSSRTTNFLHNSGRLIQEKFDTILDNDALPLVIAPVIFIVLAGLEWWLWNLEISTPYPVLLATIAFGLGAYWSYKLLGYGKCGDKQKDIQTTTSRYPKLHAKNVSDIS
ncbi:hypothetical protein [Nitrosomonas sp.]|uniref:hypothetical protein n=1 Tax=Nitrosomonas sp. TaxID=42353 RepID=UPI00374D1C54